jgi:BMFP domain-containing protein YqiC
MAQFTANTVALTRISADVMDIALRNLRLAGRSDIDRLARQLARTEDKLELLLQTVERLEDARDRG